MDPQAPEPREAGGPGRTAEAGAGSAGATDCNVDFAEHAEHAEFAEFAEHAEFAEFAEHAERAEHAEQAERTAPADSEVVTGAPAEVAGAVSAAGPAGPGPNVPEAAQHPHSHLHGHVGPDGQPDLLWRHEMLQLVDHAARSLQAAGASRLHRQDRPEPRWPVSATVLVAIVLQSVLPSQLVLRAGDLHYVLLAMESALVLALFAANPVRIDRISRPIRTASIALIVLITIANAASAVLLVKAIVTSHLQVPPHQNAAVELLVAGAAIWGTNVIAFALWYWEFDRGGPVNRLHGNSPYPDLLFTQMTVPELTEPGWGPQFADYLYLSFTNATAFSPTDVLPLARWAKLTMLVQSAVSLALGALVIARAVNILR